MHRFDQAPGEIKPGLRLRAIDDQSEFVAAQTRNHPALHRGLEPMSDLNQQLVADLVTEHIVNFLEAVKVDRQHREFLGRSLASLDHLRQRLQESGTVRQVRQRIVIGHVSHARFRLAPGRHILVGLDEILRRAVLG